MAIINYDGISGINSITSVGGGVKFYDNTGASSFTITPSGAGGASLGDVVVSSINSGPVSGTRNRIINGDMRIDQRYSGTLLTGAANPNYFCDRFGTYHDIGTLNYRQNLNSVTPPVGFTNYLGITNTSASTSASTNYYNLFHPVEGYNIADFAWGTASAKPVTLSFWVMSSIAGTYSVAFNIASNSYGYPATYTISQANTWTYVSLTIPGSTLITPNTTNGSGVVIIWDLGQGSSYRFTAGSWQSGTVQGATGSTNWNQTNGATFYLTGVQLEVGSVATPFERRSYGQELALCQRYFYTTTSTGTNQQLVNQRTNTSGNYGGAFPQIAYFPVQMRGIPTVSIYTSAAKANVGNVQVNGSINSSSIASNTSTIAFKHWNNTALTNVGDYYTFYFDANAEL